MHVFCRKLQKYSELHNAMTLIIILSIKFFWVVKNGYYNGKKKSNGNDTKTSQPKNCFSEKNADVLTSNK